jgi:hypothetical protein
MPSVMATDIAPWFSMNCNISRAMLGSARMSPVSTFQSRNGSHCNHGRLLFALIGAKIASKVAGYPTNLGLAGDRRDHQLGGREGSVGD